MAPTLTRKSTITLSYPYTTPTHTVDLPAPVFENSETLNYKTIKRKTRGYSQKVYRDSNWGGYRTLFYICEACTATQRSDYLTLVEAAYGQELKLNDYESQIWKGILLPAEITETLKSCGYVIQFEFQGLVQ